jgi:hypothetical protein
LILSPFLPNPPFERGRKAQQEKGNQQDCLMNLRWNTRRKPTCMEDVDIR